MVGADTASIIYSTSDQVASRKFINVCKLSQLQLSLYHDGEEIKPRHIPKLHFAFKLIKPHLPFLN